MAAIEADPADNRRGEYIEDHVLPLTGHNRGDASRQHQAAEPGEQAADHVDANRDAPDRDSGYPRRLLVAADGIDRAADLMITHEQGRDQKQSAGNPDRGGNSEPFRSAEIEKLLRQVEQRLAVGDP